MIAVSKSQQNNWYLSFACIAIILFVGAAAFYWFPLNLYGTTSDRDMFWGASLEDFSAFLGPNAGRSGRIPGGIYYLLLHALIKINPDPVFVYASIKVFFILSALSITCILLQLFSPIAACIFLGLATTSHLSLDSITALWSSAFALPCMFFSYAVFLHVLKTNTSKYLPLLFFCIAVAMQLHVVSGVLFATLVIPLVYLRLPIGRKEWGLGLFLLLLLYAPFLYALATHLIPKLHLGLFSLYAERLLGVGVHLQDVRHCNTRLFLHLDPKVKFSEQWGLLVYGVGLICAFSFLVLNFTKTSWRNALEANEKRILKGILLSFVLSLPFLFFGLSHCEAHYLGFTLAPCFCLFSASIYLLQKHAKKLYFALGIALSLCAIFFLALSAIKTIQEFADKNPTISNFKEITWALKEHFHYAAEAFETKVTLLVKDKNQLWQPADKAVSQSSYISRLENTLRTSPTTQSPCVLAFRCKADCPIVNKDSAFHLPLTPQFNSPNYPTIKILDSYRTNSFLFISYRLKEMGDNCLKNLTNGYIKLENEKFSTKTTNPEVFSLGRDYLTRHSIPLKDGFEKSLPFSLHFDLKQKKNTSITLYSPRLRGYGEFGEYSLSNASLRFVSNDGKPTFTIPLFQGTLGEDLYLTPWTTYHPQSIPPGNYALYLDTGAIFVNTVLSAERTSTLLFSSMNIIAE